MHTKPRHRHLPRGSVMTLVVSGCAGCPRHHERSRCMQPGMARDALRHRGAVDNANSISPPTAYRRQNARSTPPFPHLWRHGSGFRIKAAKLAGASAVKWRRQRGAHHRSPGWRGVSWAVRPGAHSCDASQHAPRATGAHPHAVSHSNDRAVTVRRTST